MNYAIINNGIIENVALSDEALDINWIELQDGFGIGDSYADGVFIKAPYVEPIITVPTTVTPRQARLALLQATLLDEVELLLANDKAMQIWWEYSLEIERNHEHINAMGAALNLNTTQLDDLFLLASTL